MGNGMLLSRMELPETRCAKCGACVTVCPVFRAEGRESLTARGRMHLLRLSEGKSASAMLENLFSRCLLCGACEQSCPRRLPITEIIAQTRGNFSSLYGPHGLQKNMVRSLLGHPRLLEGMVKAGVSLRRIQQLPLSSGLRLRLALPEDRLSSNKAELAVPAVSEQSAALNDISYFSGCFAQHLRPSIARATGALLRQLDLSMYTPPGQRCCGLAAWGAGHIEQARKQAQKNIQAVSGSSGPILASCASCSSHLHTYPSLFAEDDPWRARAQAFAQRVQEFTTFFQNILQAPKGLANDHRIFYHDPCHLRWQPEGMGTPRTLLQQAGFSIVEPEDGPHCCGQGGLFHLACPEISKKIFQQSSRQALAGRPTCITSTCSGCLMQYQLGLAQQGQSNVRVVHMALLLQEALAASS